MANFVLLRIMRQSASSTRARYVVCRVIAPSCAKVARVATFHFGT